MKKCNWIYNLLKFFNIYYKLVDTKLINNFKSLQIKFKVIEIINNNKIKNPYALWALWTLNFNILINLI